MTLPVTVATGAAEWSLRRCPTPLGLDSLIPGHGPWEVEIGFGKGRHLLERAAAEPDTRFLGIEVASKYFHILVGRARRRRLANLLAVHGEALALIGTVLPRGFARALHVYFPDPWPKARHQRRRLFDPESIDLVLGVLAPGGTLSFATDYLEYGEVVVRLLEGFPGLEVRRLLGPWPGGPRTNYEAKYVAEGREVLRVEARRGQEEALPFHPVGWRAVVAGPST